MLLIAYNTCIIIAQHVLSVYSEGRLVMANACHLRIHRNQYILPREEEEGKNNNPRGNKCQLVLMREATGMINSHHDTPSRHPILSHSPTLTYTPHTLTPFSPHTLRSYYSFTLTFMRSTFYPILTLTPSDPRHLTSSHPSHLTSSSSHLLIPHTLTLIPSDPLTPSPHSNPHPSTLQSTPRLTPSTPRSPF